MPSQIRIFPRWIIFLIDISLCIIAMLLAKTLKKNFLVYEINLLNLYKSLALCLVVNTAVFVAFKTYAGIVRFTSGQDTFRILLAVLSSTALLFGTNMVTLAIGGELFLSNVVIIIFALSSFLFLIIYRIMVKFVFVFIKNVSLDKVRVIIYGAGEAGITTKRTFDDDAKVNKQIIAFVDDDPRKVGKTILGVKILDAARLECLIVEHELDEIIFASYTIPLERKNKIVNICLENNVNVLNIPPHEVWAKGNVHTTQIQHLNIEDLLNREPIHIDTLAIQSELKGKTILITGAAGSIGSEIVRQLMQFETGLIVMCDQSETGLHNLQLELGEIYEDAMFHAFIGDVRDERRMRFLFDSFKPQYVYHAAAYKHVPMMEDNPSEAIKTNVLGTKILSDLSIQHDVEKFVMISTDKAVNPTNIMGASKRIAEIYVQSRNHSSGTRFITTRFGNVLGSNGSVIPRFQQQIEKGGPVTVTHPDITRYFMTIPEACRLVLEAGSMGKGGEIYVFDMGDSVKIADLARKMIRLAGMIPEQDIKIAFTGLRPGEKLYEELLNDEENTMPTHHEKIMIGKVKPGVFAVVDLQVHDLLNKAMRNDNQEVVLQMKRMVPEYISQNSQFEVLDTMQDVIPGSVPGSI
ncbi:polysaccharide biosynthesis protein [Pedobacter immunditicola]|uniref:polysaccharide biosynthesis protein n=1 Tax=Pedobacter immunditicola TaxID=3133440 RepID=UPI0030AFD76E